MIVIKDAFCFSCDYLSDVVVEYGLDDGSGTVLICLDCKKRLEGTDG